MINLPRSRQAGCPAARATGGMCVCSPARRILWSDECGRLYETCSCLGSGSFGAPAVPSSSDETWILWEFVGINRNLWGSLGHRCERCPDLGPIWAAYTHKLCLLVTEAPYVGWTCWGRKFP